MAGGFLTKRILLVKEQVPGVIPANPVCLEFLSETFDLKETQSSEEINILGAGGDASPMSFGASTYSGSVGLVASVDNMPMIFTHIAGIPLSTANATAQTFPTIATAVAVGDMFNHSDGKHTLTCVEAGTTAITAITLASNPNDDRNKKIVSGTATFIAMPLLKKYTFKRKQQIPSFTIEYELEDAASTKFYKRFSGVRLNAMPMGMTGGTISLKISGDFLGTKATDSTKADWDTNLVAKTGAVVVPQFKGFYSYEDCTVKVDDVALCEVEAINLDVTRNVTVTPAVNNCKITDIGVTSVKGSMNRVFTIEDYESFREHTDFKVEFDFKKSNGCEATITYPYVKPSMSDPAQTIDKQAYLTAELSAYGTSANQSFSAVVIAPALVSDTGSVIGTY